MRYKQIVFAFVVLCLCFTAFTAESVAFSAPAKVTKVTVSASPPIPVDNRELRYDLTGLITTNGPATVNYYWLRSDIKVPSTNRITFSSAGTQNVTSHLDVVKTSQAQRLWVQVKITSPNQIISKQVEIIVPAAK